jgi:hypothetical protein
MYFTNIKKYSCINIEYKQIHSIVAIFIGPVIIMFLAMNYKALSRDTLIPSMKFITLHLSQKEIFYLRIKLVFNHYKILFRDNDLCISKLKDIIRPDYLIRIDIFKAFLIYLSIKI